MKTEEIIKILEKHQEWRLDKNAPEKTDDNKCDKGWHTGECCCNCKNQIELFKHPWNKEAKGEISESTGTYACIAQFDCDGDRKGVLFEKQHGFCEMHVPE